MKFVILAVVVFFTVLTAQASIEVSIIGSDAQIVDVAAEAGESDLAQFTLVVSMFAINGDVYIPIDPVQMMTIDWGSASSQIAGFTPFVTSMGESSDGFFVIEEGTQENFWMSVFATVNQDTVAQLQITGLNWTDQVDGDLVTSVQAPPLETDQLFINTIVPEPGAIVLMTIGGGILSIIAIRRQRSAQKR
jgi:hypothetical protein